MPRKKYGIYGTFEPKGLDKAVKKYRHKKGISGDMFFTELVGHKQEWWRSLVARQFGEETELKTICQAVGYNPQKINFRAGEVNEKVQEDRDTAIKKYNKAYKEDRETRKKFQEKDCQQQEFDFGKDEDFDKKIVEMPDHDLIHILGPKRIRELYHLASYEEEKGLLK